MSKVMLIDATQPEEVRVAVVEGNRLEEYDLELASKKQKKGNIYLAKVIRIEPSLQAAFVEYGENRHGFLPFGEIHPDYYQIPVVDREKVLAQAEVKESDLTDEVKEGIVAEDSLEKDEILEVVPRRPRYRYKIQEVIKHRQILLVQVVKEGRGNKGAALTTYLTLAGRYCVLMPNSGHRSGGISRKISSVSDRQHLKEILSKLTIPEHMSVIVRTAGQDRTKSEIKKDFEYLIHLWEEIRDLTLQSVAPKIVYSEGDIIHRAIRDIYQRDIEKIYIEGDVAFKEAKEFMRKLIPSHVKKIVQYRKPIPLLQEYNVESQIASMFHSTVQLPSGGLVVINTTEALVAIDVNSSRATRERHIDDTALKTNLEAANEIARQMRLRDLAGLIVIDFIDMHDKKHIQNVEKRFREALKDDRARIQLGHISEFGLFELSRQRLHPSLIELSTVTCMHCQGTGTIRSVESLALSILRALEVETIKHPETDFIATVPSGVDLYLLNQKRARLMEIEQQRKVSILVHRNDALPASQFLIQPVSSLKNEPTEEVKLPKVPKEQAPNQNKTKKHPPKKEPHIQHVDVPRESKKPVEQGDVLPSTTPAEKKSFRHRRRRSYYHKQQRQQHTSTAKPQSASHAENSPVTSKSTKKSWWRKLLES